MTGIFIFKGEMMNRKLTPLKAIRAKCLDCSCFQSREVKLCTMTECSLYIYRFGHNPARKGIGATPIPKTVVESVNSVKEKGVDHA